MQERTDWLQVTLIIVAGIIGAFQIGKVAIAIPILREDLGLSLFAISWIAGSYAALGVVGGIAAGFVFSSFPLRYVIAFGLGLIACGNFLGASSPDATLLIVSRVVEGIGFLAMIIACPTYLRTVVTSRSQQIAFTLWAAYMPVGMVMIMLAGPLVMHGDWRWLWTLNGILAVAHAMVILAIRQRGEARATQRSMPTSQDVAAVFKAGAPVLLALAFMLYTIQYFALTTFLPTFLIDQMGLSLAMAGTVSALAIAANAVGNISAGFILRMGVPLWALFTVVFTIIGLSSFIIFHASSPPALAAFGAGICLGAAALLPASIIVTMPRLLPSTQQLALAMGTVQQASSVGQLAGPAALALLIEWQGWSGGTYLLCLLAICGLAIALRVKRMVR